MTRRNYNTHMPRRLAILFLLLALVAAGALLVMQPNPAAYAPAAAPRTPLVTSYLPLVNREALIADLPSLQASEFGFELRWHPEAGLFVGDQLSLEVIAPPGMELAGSLLEVSLAGQALGSGEFWPYGLAGRNQATLTWFWDTADLDPGHYALTFRVSPEGPAWQEIIFLHPAEALAEEFQGAAWAEARSACCVVHYVTGTAAERDLPTILQTLDRQAELAALRMSLDFIEPIPIVLLPRVLGHGGFTSREIAISYLDRNYANNDLAQVALHEMTHLLDDRLNPHSRPTLLVEGLAVYVSRGHYKPEPLLARSAALLALDRYMPLLPLADDFYPSQHEIGYMQAGALVQFLVESYGWRPFFDFYGDVELSGYPSQSAAISAALQRHFGLDFAALEQSFLAELQRRPLPPDLLDDVRLTVAYYDAVRRYQQALDPSAYFLTAWLPDPEQMRQRGIVADYLRHPESPRSIELETRLVEAGQALRQGRFPEAELLVAQVHHLLDRLDLPGFSEQTAY